MEGSGVQMIGVLTDVEYDLIDRAVCALEKLSGVSASYDVVLENVHPDMLDNFDYYSRSSISW